MADILDKIVARKRQEVAEAKEKRPVQELEKLKLFNRKPLSLSQFLGDKRSTGIIAEFKRRSPSKGIINDQVSVEEVVTGYESAGASAISVLTDRDFFMGHERDLLAARAAVKVPLLRKDFMVDEYQIIEAKAIGADIILLIAAVLSPQEVARLGALARLLGLSVLLEVHNLDELQRSLHPSVDVVGVNNRNL
ncbi:MAG: indole-3-glycerol-phosphate synthase, partial [Mucilaginibacter polytrichastri]|nr:indole-3-glycerol-phosphate synthase [Mucilaginibacter polytrichastri]